jgi:2,4-dienoyl-CoA reductase-like NADH-dependent reductase (Old Yellow Enzyme family)
VAQTSERPLLFQPITLRGVTARNRIVLAPLCQYSAKDGVANDWHLVHLGKFAIGGMGIVMTEAAAVEPRGRISHGDIGVWTDAQADALKPITTFLAKNGAVPAIQLAHAGRKASMQRPWHGSGPLNEADAARGDTAWSVVGPSTQPVGLDWLTPSELSELEIHDIVQNFAAAAGRASAAGFDVAEIHGAHGYLISTFLSPSTNTRTDGYGGDLAGRMRFALEVTEAVRSVWPDDKPLFFRLSSVDGAEDGWSLDDSIALARELKARGIDVIDCSSGGLTGSSTIANTYRGPGFQVPYAARIRRDADIKTMAVGLIMEAKLAEDILQAGDADLIAIGREAMYDPYWAHHAAQTLGSDSEFTAWPEQAGWWLDKRAKSLSRQKT